MENIMEIMQFAIFALACFTLALVLKTYRDRILRFTADLINKAEDTVKGSGMGPEKKALVIAQLEAAGIRVTTWLANWIDDTVDFLNNTGGWFATQTKQHANQSEEAAEK